MSVYEKLKALDITLAAPATPAAAYVMYAQTGNLVFLSGHIAKRADGSVWVGQLGKNIDTAEGKAAARAIAIDLIGTLQAAGRRPDPRQAHRQSHEPGELHGGFHRTAPGHQWRLRAAGRSLRRRRQARPSAFGVAQIPLGACVEIELIAEVA
jgi:enamine deaminase RidA (YjgF/YER057c/UK114 family)